MVAVRNAVQAVCGMAGNHLPGLLRGQRQVDGISCRRTGDHCESGSWHGIPSVRSVVIDAPVGALRSITSTATSITQTGTFVVCVLRAMRRAPVCSDWLPRQPSARNSIGHRGSTKAPSEGHPGEVTTTPRGIDSVVSCKVITRARAGPISLCICSDLRPPSSLPCPGRHDAARRLHR